MLHYNCTTEMFLTFGPGKPCKPTIPKSPDSPCRHKDISDPKKPYEKNKNVHSVYDFMSCFKAFQSNEFNIPQKNVLCVYFERT